MSNHATPTQAPPADSVLAKPPAWRALLLPTVLALAVALALFRGARESHFAGDESGWISAAFYHAGLVLDGDFSHASWVAPECDAYSNTNPQLGKVLLGLPLWAYAVCCNGGHIYSGYYTFHGKSYEENLAEGRVPPRNMLLAGRLIASCFGAACFLLAAWYAYRCGGRLAAVLATAVLLAQPLLVAFFSRAMTDSYYNLFVLATVCAMLPYVQAKTPRARIGWALLVGVLIGCATSVKVTGAVALGPLFVLVWAAHQWHLRPGWRSALAPLLLSGATALFVIYALNPFYWPDFSVLDWHALRSEWQTRDARMAAVHAAQGGKTIWDTLTANEYERGAWEAQFPQWSNLLRPMEFPLIYLRWNHFFEWLLTYIPWTEWRPLAILRMVFQELAVAFPMEIPFFLAGVVVALRRARDAWAERRIDACGLLLIHFCYQFVLLFLLMPLPMRRFFVPCVLAMHLLSALGLATTIHAAMQRRTAFAAGRAGQT